MDYGKIMASEICSQLETGTAPFGRAARIGELQAPYNPLTGLPYRGLSQFRLMARQNRDPRWVTAEQLKNAGMVLRPGAKSVTLPFTVTSVNKNEFKAKTGMKAPRKPATVTVDVYNAADVIGMPPVEYKLADRDEVIRKAENLINNSGVRFVFAGTDKGDHHYVPDTNTIYMPGRHRFGGLMGNPEEFHATAVYELAKAKAYQLDKNLEHSHRNPKAALCATLASHMFAAETGMNTLPKQNKYMIKDWIELIKTNPAELSKICRTAELVKNELVREADCQVLKLETSRPKAFAFSRQAAGMEY